MYRITFSSSDLKPAISRLSKVVRVDSLIQIMECALLKVYGTTATLTGTDTQITITTEIPCESDGQISVAIPFVDLQNLSKVVPNNISVVMEIKVDDSSGAPSFSVHIEAGKSKWDYVAFDPILYPTAPSLDGALATELDPELVLGMITAQDFCGMNPFVGWTTAVALIADGANVRAVGVATSALYESAAYPISDMGGREEIMIPRAGVGIISALPSTTGIQLLLPADLNESSVAIKQDGTTAHIRLIDGKFVAYKTILPTNYTLGFVCNAEELLDAVRSVSIGTRTDGPKGQVELDVKGLTLTLTAHNYDAGKTGTSSIELIANNGGDIKAIFSSSIMIDHLSKLNGPTTVKHAGVHNKCFLFQDESLSATHLIMPMTLPS